MQNGMRVLHFDDYFETLSALWDDPLEDQRDLWENITVEEILDDSSDDQHVIPARVASISCPTSPVMVRSVRSISNREGAAGVSFSLPRNQGPDTDLYTLESLKNLQTRSRSEDHGNKRHQRRNPFNQREDPLGDTAVRDYFTSDEATASPVNDVLLLEEDYYDKEEKPVVNEGQMKQNDNINNNAKKQDNSDPESQGATSNTGKSNEDENDDKQYTWKFLSVDDIYLSYWKISVSIHVVIITRAVPKANGLFYTRDFVWKRMPFSRMRIVCVSILKQMLGTQLNDLYTQTKYGLGVSGNSKESLNYLS